MIAAGSSRNDGYFAKVCCAGDIRGPNIDTDANVSDRDDATQGERSVQSEDGARYSYAFSVFM